MGVGVEWVAEREREKHLEIWKTVVHLKSDKLLLVLPDLKVYNRQAAMAGGMCAPWRVQCSRCGADQGHSTWASGLGLAEPSTLGPCPIRDRTSPPGLNRAPWVRTQLD